VKGRFGLWNGGAGDAVFSRRRKTDGGAQGLRRGVRPAGWERGAVFSRRRKTNGGAGEGSRKGVSGLPDKMAASAVL
jgi:hypothetical protein